MPVAKMGVILYFQWKTHVHQILVMKMHVVMITLVMSLVIVTLDTLGMESHAQVMSLMDFLLQIFSFGKYPFQCSNKNGTFPFVADIDECSATVCTHTHLRCVNAQGSYACCCEQGYTWDGSDCVGRFAAKLVFQLIRI